MKAVKRRVRKPFGNGVEKKHVKILSTEPTTPKTMDGEVLEVLETTAGKYPTCSTRFFEFCHGKDKFLAASFEKKKDMINLFLENYGFKETKFKGKTVVLFFGIEKINVMGRTDLESVMGIFDPAFSRLEPEIL